MQYTYPKFLFCNNFLWLNIIANISIIYVALFVVKILPVLLSGKTSKTKLIVVADKNKLTKLFPFKNL